MSTTLVTGLWDIKRSELSEGWGRSFEEHYISKFKDLLELDCNLIIYGNKELHGLVERIRDDKNTQFIERDVDWFKNEFYSQIQNIRANPKWLDQAGWLAESTQAKLEMYNPLVMSKMFLLNDASILDKFNSDYLFWIDAGITNTVHPGYFSHDKVLDRIPNYVGKFNFVAFPYKANTEIHGFAYPEINNYATDNVELVCRGGFFGGPKETISQANGLYYSELKDTLSNSHMGTEESVFSILLYKYPEIFSYAAINEDGLINTFFENLKNNKIKLKSTGKVKNFGTVDYKKTGLYVITYNSPEQFRILCNSMELYDPDFLKLPQKFLLNNSLDKDTDNEYKLLCEKYGFTEIKKDNIGICGGRQFIAEHFNEQEDLKYYLFFEDDMFFYNGEDTFCKNGFVRKIQQLYKIALKIVNKEELDFLKLNFTEFFGDNQKQWAWHNLPADKRSELFPEKPRKVGNDVNQAPYLNFKNIKSYNNIPYALGDVYYCNWPQIVTREGNKKMFLDTTWKYPYEQTWMSHFYQMTIKNELKSGVLLVTPTEHDRFDFYPGEERREN